MKIEIPEELESLRDFAVAFIYGQLKQCPDLKPLEDYFENGDGWDDVVMSFVGTRINLEELADSYFSNTILRDFVNIEANSQITKTQKLAFARERIKSEISESSDAIHAVQISEDPSAFLVCIIESRGQGGWEVNWQGLCKSIDELTNINENFLSDIYDVDKISDELNLKLWTN